MFGAWANHYAGLRSLGPRNTFEMKGYIYARREIQRGGPRLPAPEKNVPHVT